MDEAVNGEYIWEGIKPSPVRPSTATRWNFHSEMNTKTDHWHFGMHKRGSFHDIVNVTDCQIVDEDYRKFLHVHWNVRENQDFHIITVCAMLDISATCW